MLNLNANVDVVVRVGAVATARTGYNVGRILGESTVIPSTERVRKYETLAAMLDDGFDTSDLEYLAAEKYFAQAPAPKEVMIGSKVGGQEAPEAWVEAVTACVDASDDWYALYCCGIETADILTVAAYIETLNNHVLFYDTSEETALAGDEGDVFSALKTLSYSRCIGLYSATGYAGAALMGFAMGANDGTVNSAYTLKFKSLAGVAPDSLTATQVSTIKTNNGNIYVTRGGVYSGIEEGVMANGDFFDHRLGVDQLAYNIQMGVSDLLYNTTTKIPQTEAGMTQLKTAVAADCERAVRTGFLADGIWTEPAVLNLETGDAIAGYVVQSEPIDEQPSADRDRRIAPNIYVSIKEAGAVHGVNIAVIVDR